jgi:hypothetical protein
LLCCCLLLLGTARAQAQHEHGGDHHDGDHDRHHGEGCGHGDDHHAENSLESGAWALQFRIWPDFTLASFQGATISAKKQLSPTSAFRFGFTPDASYRTTGSEEDGEEDPRSISQNTQWLSIDAQWLRYTSLRDEVTLFYGAGPEFSFERREQTTEDDRTGFENSDIGTFIGAGVLGTVGAEWFMRSNISLTAEYQTSLRYLREVDSSEAEREDRSIERSVTTNEVRLDARGVLFGVSVYF